jgi:type II secretory pathway component PulC
MDAQQLWQLLHKHQQRLPLLLGTLVLIIFAWHMVGTLDIFTLKLPKIEISSTAPSAPKPISDYHLLGYFADNYADLPETQLQLTLQGTGVDPKIAKKSIAIVSGSSTGSAKIYHPGELVPGGALIKAIQSDQIVIDNNGELQKLSMPIPSLHMAPAPSVSNQSGLSS